MRHSTRLLGVLALSLAIAQPALAQRGKAKAGVARGEMLAQSCFACHGPKGGSLAGPIPTIGGQGAPYVVGILTAFKEGTRPATVMTRLMKGYSEEDISALAQYLSALPFQRPEQTVDKAKVELGKAAYQKACKRCHLEGGRESSEAEYPILAGQQLSYLQMEIADITSNTRKADAKLLEALGKLSKDEIEAVLHFFAAQR